MSILTVDFAGKDLVKGRIGQVYTVTENNNTGWGFTMDMLKLEVSLKLFFEFNENCENILKLSNSSFTYFCIEAVRHN
jgi:hypothetical protein